MMQLARAKTFPLVALWFLLATPARAIVALPLEHDWTVHAPGGEYGIQGYYSPKSGSVTWVVFGPRSYYIPLPCYTLASVPLLGSAVIWFLAGYAMPKRERATEAA